MRLLPLALYLMPHAEMPCLQDFVPWFDAALSGILPYTQERQPAALARLDHALHYSLSTPGKRLRPYLLTASAALFGIAPRISLPAAVAVEMVHCYSLIHDDLPAMDNSPLRRGRETLHIKTDEATAILAGDALLTNSFSLLAEPQTHPEASIRLELIKLLSDAAGSDGMVGGQMIDLAGQAQLQNLADVENLHFLKTGALICAACEMGAVIGAASPAARAALCRYGALIGLAFQVIDDVLDVIPQTRDSDRSKTGKPALQDLDKTTYVALLGIAGAKTKAAELVDEACEQLGDFGDQAAPLKELARFILDRHR